MKKLAVSFCALLFLFLTCAFYPSAAHSALTDRIIIKFHPTVSSQTRDDVVKQFPIIRKENLRLKDTIALNIPKGQANAFAKKFAKNPNVQYAEEDFVAKALDVPNDPDYLSQW